MRSPRSANDTINRRERFDIPYIRWLGRRADIERFDRIQIDRNKEQAAWAERVRGFLERGIEVWAYFNNHWAGHSPASPRLPKVSGASARQFAELLGIGTGPPAPWHRPPHRPDVLREGRCDPRGDRPPAPGAGETPPAGSGPHGVRGAARGGYLPRGGRHLDLKQRPGLELAHRPCEPGLALRVGVWQRQRLHAVVGAADFDLHLRPDRRRKLCVYNFHVDSLEFTYPQHAVLHPHKHRKRGGRGRGRRRSTRHGASGGGAGRRRGGSFAGSSRQHSCDQETLSRGIHQASHQAHHSPTAPNKP
ncbi:MAG: DUF72 domain-containing protein [Chloroflexi bacterium]|nr:DUF72 domain-containing protein [Chloroflexota bacterium]